MMKDKARISPGSTRMRGPIARASGRASGASSIGVSHPATTATMNPIIRSSANHSQRTIRPPRARRKCVVPLEEVAAPVYGEGS